MTKTKFLEALKAEVLKRYDWANDDARLVGFLDKTELTLNGDRNLVMIDGDSFVAAWRSIGGKGKPTFKALRAMPA